MQIQVDTHVHSLLSGHAGSTINELALAAADRGLKAIVITEHGPAISLALPAYYFEITELPKYKHGVRIFFGCEANVLASSGELDIPADVLAKLDFVLAGEHQFAMHPRNADYDTRAMLNLMKNPFVDCITHPENPSYNTDMERIVDEAVKYNKILEINNNSFLVRPGGRLPDLVALCKERGVRITVASDAHLDTQVGGVEKAMELVVKAGFPEEMVVNRSLESFEAAVRERHKRIDSFLTAGGLYL